MMKFQGNRGIVNLESESLERSRVGLEEEGVERKMKLRRVG